MKGHARTLENPAVDDSHRMVAADARDYFGEAHETSNKSSSDQMNSVGMKHLAGHGRSTFSRATFG